MSTYVQCIATPPPSPAVRIYCECMVDKMEDSETQTVTRWEKTHVAERKACDKEAGWR
jgi:hypothetical protein